MHPVTCICLLVYHMLPKANSSEYNTKFQLLLKYRRLCFQQFSNNGTHIYTLYTEICDRIQCNLGDTCALQSIVNSDTLSVKNAATLFFLTNQFRSGHRNTVL